jgi:hypothetical protein
VYCRISLCIEGGCRAVPPQLAYAAALPFPAANSFLKFGDYRVEPLIFFFERQLFWIGHRVLWQSVLVYGSRQSSLL